MHWKCLPFTNTKSQLKQQNNLIVTTLRIMMYSIWYLCEMMNVLVEGIILLNKGKCVLFNNYVKNNGNIWIREVGMVLECESVMRFVGCLFLIICLCTGLRTTWDKFHLAIIMLFKRKYINSMCYSSKLKYSAQCYLLYSLEIW